MADFTETPDDVVEELLPTDDEAADGEAQLLATEESLDFPADLIIAEEPPPPFGRGWQFDFGRQRFTGPDLPSAIGRSPLRTFGPDTLRFWIEKALQTARGAHPIYGDDYGMDQPFDLIGQPFTEATVVELEQRVQNALLVHPKIADVTDFDAEINEDELFVSFRVILDNDVALDFPQVALA